MGKKKILIIDDEVNFTKLAKLNLEQTGEYDIVTENMGANALNTIRWTKPDLILLDVVMPDMDGSEIAAQLKEDEKLKNIPVVFLTAIVMKKEVDGSGGVIGGHPFIAKPVSTQQLLAAIKKNLEKST